MRERAKRIGVRLEIWSREGAGTDVEVSAPGSIAYESSSARPGLSAVPQEGGTESGAE